MSGLSVSVLQLDLIEAIPEKRQGMYHSGIGGGGFMLVRGPDGEVESIDFRETAPYEVSENMYQGNVNGSIHGGLASGVPGELKGLEYLHTKYGVGLLIQLQQYCILIYV